MAETSFPVLEQPLSDQQWGQVTAGIGSGVLGQTTGNYAYSGVSNADNTAQLSAGGGQAQAIVSGFYHRIDSNHTISLPAVPSGTRTYYIGLTYDPTKHAAPTGPVSITVTTTKPSGGGKVYLPLYEVVRSANQLLTEAALKVRRVLISPTLAVAAIDEMPDASTMMQGTLCQTTNTNMIWRASSGNWVPVNAVGLAQPSGMPGWEVTIPAGGIELQYLESGRRIARASNVQMRRASGAPAFTQGTGWQSHGQFIPSSLLGAGWVQVPATLAFETSLHAGAVRINTGTGALQFRLGSGTQTIQPGHEILFSASWAV